METLVSNMIQMLDGLSPTTWLLIPGLLVSAHLLGRALD